VQKRRAIMQGQLAGFSEFFWYDKGILAEIERRAPAELAHYFKRFTVPLFRQR
jgi:hypothetical protein